MVHMIHPILFDHVGMTGAGNELRLHQAKRHRTGRVERPPRERGKHSSPRRFRQPINARQLATNHVALHAQTGFVSTRASSVHCYASDGDRVQSCCVADTWVVRW